MKSTQTHFLEQLDEAFSGLDVLATWSTTVASNVGIVSLTDGETGALLGSVSLDIQAEYAVANITDHLDGKHRVSIAFTPGWLKGTSFDQPTGIDRIVTYALDPTGDCQCSWHPTSRTPPRDEQYGESMCIFHSTSFIDDPVTTT